MDYYRLLFYKTVLCHPVVNIYIFFFFCTAARAGKDPSRIEGTRGKSKGKRGKRIKRRPQGQQGQGQ